MSIGTRAVLEVIALGHEDAVAAQARDADRLELVTYVAAEMRGGAGSPRRKRTSPTPSDTGWDSFSMERRAGLAPAFPRRKRGVFPWTTNAEVVHRFSFR
jgi:hypothetical protein